MAEIVRALRPFKVQTSVGEYLHFKTGDRIPHDLLTGPYRGYVMGHCEITNTKVAGHVPIANPQRTVEPAAKLVQPPPPLKEQWKNVPKEPVQNVPSQTESMKAPAALHGGAAMPKQADGGAGKAAHAPQPASKGHPTGKAKPHA